MQNWTALVEVTKNQKVLAFQNKLNYGSYERLAWTLSGKEYVEARTKKHANFTTRYKWKDAHTSPG